ncbi:MAG: MBL fold metallo-hydrolase [Caldilineaceae bacterium]
MKLTFLGTAAANAFPEAFCSCPNCTQARALGGPSLRKRSAALINDDLLIDMGPDIMAAANQHGIPLTRVRFCLQTHAHADHLDTSHFLSRSPAYGVRGAPHLHYYASPGTLRVAAKLLEGDCAPHGFLSAEAQAELNLQVHQIEAMQEVEMGDYRVLALPANHDPSVDSLLYVIRSGGRTIFYGTDTAPLFEEVWRAFHQHKLRFDLVVLDHTYGPDEPDGDHLSARGVIAHMQRLRYEGLLNSAARILATHIAHEGNPPHPALVAFAAANGYEVAYDGLTV